MPRRGGDKPRPFSKAAASGRISENRVMWATVHHGTWIMKLMPANDDFEGEGIAVGFNGSSGRSWGLTTLTEEELDAVEKFWTKAIAAARPIVQERDKAAREALANGDDSHIRLYRQPPIFVERQRPQREHGAGVHVGPDGVPDVGVVEDGGEADGLRASGYDVAQREPEGLGAQDDGPEADVIEGVGTVREVADD